MQEPTAPLPDASPPATETATHNTPTPVTGREPTYYYIDQPNALLRTLYELQQRRSELHLRLDHDYRQYKYYSAAQQVDADHRHLILHQLRPGNWRELISEARAVEVSAFLPSGALRFATTIAPLAGDELFCTLAFPERIAKTQQRAFYRVPLVTQNLRAELVTVTASFEVRIIDFSLGGCGLQLNPEQAAQLPGTGAASASTPQEPLNCQVVLRLDSLELSIQAELRRTRTLPSQQVLLGLRFPTLAPPLRRNLQSLLSALERQQLRRQSGLYEPQD